MVGRPANTGVVRLNGSTSRLKDDALAIWQAGVAAVDSHQLVREAVQVDGERLEIAGTPVPFTPASRLVVVGAGKAGAGMAAGLEEALGAGLVEQLDLQGWVNVPADCVRPLKRLSLIHISEPTRPY